MPAIRFAAVALFAVCTSQAASAACYVLYGPDKQIIYRDDQPPVDMSYQLHQTVPQVVPGGTMVFSPDEYDCQLKINKLPVAGTTNITPARPPRADRG